MKFVFPAKIFFWVFKDKKALIILYEYTFKEKKRCIIVKFKLKIKLGLFAWACTFFVIKFPKKKFYLKILQFFKIFALDSERAHKIRLVYSFFGYYPLITSYKCFLYSQFFDFVKEKLPSPSLGHNFLEFYTFKKIKSLQIK